MVFNHFPFLLLLPCNHFFSHPAFFHPHITTSPINSLPQHPPIQTVSSSARKSRKAHFTAASSERRQIMSSSLSKILREQHQVRSMPIRKGDTVKIVRGPDELKGKEAKVTAVYRKRYMILLDGVAHNNAKGTSVQYPIHPSNCIITELYMNGNRAAILTRKAAGKKVSENKKVKA